jgi:hypothetical protein
MAGIMFVQTLVKRKIVQTHHNIPQPVGNLM